MKLNERSLAYYATCDSPADKMGFLYKKGDRHGIYRCLWFVLKGNLLFYFDEETSREPAGVIVLEGCTVELCDSPEEFTFAIRFHGGGARAYVLAADSQTDMEAWVKTLSRANFDYMRLVVRELEQELERVQRGSAMQRRSQRRAAITRRRPVSTPAAGLRSASGSPSKGNDEPAEKPPASTKTLPNGYRDLSGAGSGWEYSGSGSAQPPPLPPRRRMTVPAVAPLTLESPVCPGTACFAKLHEWYGKEIEELRRAWVESRPAAHE